MEKVKWYYGKSKMQIIDSACELIAELDRNADDYYQKCYTIVESALECENDNLKNEMLNIFDKHRKA